MTSKIQGGRRYLPFVFTEQGVSMLSTVLKSNNAIQVSISIMNAFVEMRKILSYNASIFQRLEKVEIKQLESDNLFAQLFKAIEEKNIPPKNGIFFNGEIFDAYFFKVTHDRFLILDRQKMYHFGASFKDLGKKWVAFSEMSTLCNDILLKLNL